MAYRPVGAAIHEGSCTVIHRGQRDYDPTPVVIKLPRGEVTPRDIERLRHEYSILKSIDAPGVVKALSLEPSERGVALVLEALPGETLAAMLRARRLDVATALKIGRGIAGILASVHQRGIVHRDVKPQNLLYHPETGSVYLLDFGLAMRLSEATGRGAEAMTGTLAYLAPEQTGRMNRPLDHRADLYAFGVTLYQMLTAYLPFTTTDPVELVHSHIARVPAAPREVDGRIPEVVSALVMKLLAKAPEDRYQTARGVELDLAACIRQIEETGAVETFVLGRHDTAAALHLPERLYGRSVEEKALLDAFERARLGPAELVLIAGPSGVGKSALVHELRRSLPRDGARFISGKFDLLSRSVPYGPVIQAFRELLQQLLGESAGELATLQARLSRVLSGNGRVIVDLVPEFADILGPQPALPVVGPAESQNRMSLVLKSFMQVFTSPERPLVLFLDDLQWADPGSLKLLELLLADRDCPGLLLLGAYRDNEVDAAHPLTATLAALRNEGVAVSEIGLRSLGAPELAQLLGDALAVDPLRARPLAMAVLAKTQGNPFFVGQFLHALHEGQQIRYDAEQSAWRWDLEAIEAREVTDNVVDLIVRNLALLAPETQRVLRLAACIGHTFTLQTLSTIDELSPERTADALLPAIREGLVVQEASDRYRFLHNRVQQAAYATIDEADRAATHLRIGRLLLAGMDPGAPDRAHFEVAFHLNHGEAQMRDPAERLALAERNLDVGRRAKASNAYEAAASHFRVGTTLLPESAWQDLYALTFALHLELAECDYLCGRFEQAEASFERLVERARSKVDLGNVFALELRLYQVAGKYAEAVDVGFRALRRLGIEIPETDEAVQAATIREMQEVKALLGETPIEALVDAPLMTDPEPIAVMSILNELLSCSYIGRPAVFALSVMRAVRHSLRHGNSPESCYSYSCYAVLLVTWDQIPTAVAVSEMAMALNERFGDAASRGRVLHVHGNHIHFWVRHYRTCFPIVERAFDACLAVGEFVNAGFIAHAVTWLALERGDALDDVVRFSERFAAFAKQSRNELILLAVQLTQQFARSLTRPWLPDRPLDDDRFSGDFVLATFTRAGFRTGIAFYHITLLMLHYTAGQYEQAVASADRARDVLDGVPTLPIEPTFYLYEALALLARGPVGDAEAARRDQERIDTSRDKLARYAEFGPENYEHKHLLVCAEASRVAGRHLEADDLYDRAILSARTYGFTPYEALANELAGRALLARGRHLLAPVYLREAHAAYVRWGAAHKAERLTKEHPHIVAHGLARVPATHASASASTSAGRGVGGMVDMATVLRLGQALAGEMELPKVIEQLMRIVLSNAGATRGALILDREGVLRIEATISLGPDIVTVCDAGPMDASADLPSSVIRYAARTREAVVLGDVAADARFAKDASLRGRGVLSILCLPLVHQRRLVGVLHLENGLVRDAFGLERVEFLELLCAQAATALENALLVGRLQATSQALRQSNERLEAEVAERTHDLVEVNTRLTQELVERERAEQARVRLQEEIIRVQADLLLELSTPLIPITDDILVMPLIGEMDARRAERVMDTVLSGAQSSGARVVIMDITGMKTVDAEAASALIRAASALRLLGMQAWLTGVRQDVAQTLIALGIDLGGILTFGSLKRGVAHAARLARVTSR
ncbi:AAA family ATPase [Polyangium sp. 15x6]|uniref:AAA family ATPase n=1 Tax=Polyangium sp. 15x6 TaxID=3042687 RepID=UPI00249A5A1C|nr:AAA family ATPase [Polyangium sp. 15x6]MDI3289448.1 AAA family ATPase [Polyangium sp. 15x6]